LSSEIFRILRTVVRETPAAFAIALYPSPKALSRAICSALAASISRGPADLVTAGASGKPCSDGFFTPNRTFSRSFTRDEFHDLLRNGGFTRVDFLHKTSTSAPEYRFQQPNSDCGRRQNRSAREGALIPRRCPATGRCDRDATAVGRQQLFGHGQLHVQIYLRLLIGGFDNGQDPRGDPNFSELRKRYVRGDLFLR